VRVLLLQVGHTFEEIARIRGDYDSWFRAGLELEESEFEVRRVFEGAPLPDHFDYDAALVTGSWSMVTDREPWSEASGDYLREAVDRKLPLLAVCYGHQLLAHALGGTVGYNPTGRHAGSSLIELTEEAVRDPLFGVFESPMAVHVSHSQRVLDLPAEAVLLARCERDPYHAFRVGECAWGVQFHPEFSAETARDYIRIRSGTIAAEGLDPDALLRGVRETADGERLLRRFRALLGT
jgi:GMP synthase (glutamine-hydrolysing)